MTITSISSGRSIYSLCRKTVFPRRKTFYSSSNQKLFSNLNNWILILNLRLQFGRSYVIGGNSVETTIIYKSRAFITFCNWIRIIYRGNCIHGITWCTSVTSIIWTTITIFTWAFFTFLSIPENPKNLTCSWSRTRNNRSL